MTIKRLLTQIRFWSFGGNGYKRAQYAKKKGIYAEVGVGSTIPVPLPLYPQLVRIHNNVIMHRSVQLVTHDTLNTFLMKTLDSCQFKNRESLCPIEIFDNVYIGMDVVILGNVRIGPNVIINAGSLVMNDIQPNSIVGGIPAKVLGSLDKYAKLRLMKENAVPYEFHRCGAEVIDQKTTEIAWEYFDSKRSKNENKEKENMQQKLMN